MDLWGGCQLEVTLTNEFPSCGADLMSAYVTLYQEDSSDLTRGFPVYLVGVYDRVGASPKGYVFEISPSNM